MTIKEFMEILEQLKSGELTENYWYAGIRFEDKDRKEGEIITDLSRNNVDRDDEREFPEYGTPEYEEMEVLDGVSAWELSVADMYNRPTYGVSEDVDVRKVYPTKHCYLIASDDVGGVDSVLDDGEIVLVEPTVIKKIF